MTLFKHDQRRVFAFTVFVLVAWTAEGLTADIEPKPTAEQIFRVWKDRQDRIQSARFQIKEMYTTIEGTRFGKNQPWNPQRDKKSSPKRLPAADTTNELTLSLLFQGSRIRYTREGKEWVDTEEDFLPSFYVSVYDGTESKAYYGRSSQEVHPLGFVNSNNKRNQDVYTLRLRALLVAYRALDSKILGLKPEEWKTSDVMGSIAGRNCVVLEKISRNDKETYWVDPKRDYIVLRYLRSNRGKVASQLDVSYRQDASFGWVPSEWNFARFYSRTGKVFESAAAQVTDYKINPPVNEDAFRFVFPPNTEVQDRQSSSRYIMREHGDKRLISSGEIARGATYDQLLATESGRAALPPQSPWRRWRLYASIVGLLLLLTVWVWRWRKAVRKSNL